MSHQVFFYHCCFLTKFFISDPKMGKIMKAGKVELRSAGGKLVGASHKPYGNDQARGANQWKEASDPDISRTSSLMTLRIWRKM